MDLREKGGGRLLGGVEGGETVVGYNVCKKNLFSIKKVSLNRSLFQLLLFISIIIHTVSINKQNQVKTSVFLLGDSSLNQH